MGTLLGGISSAALFSNHHHIPNRLSVPLLISSSSLLNISAINIPAPSSPFFTPFSRVCSPHGFRVVLVRLGKPDLPIPPSALIFLLPLHPPLHRAREMNIDATYFAKAATRRRRLGKACFKYVRQAELRSAYNWLPMK